MAIGRKGQGTLQILVTLIQVSLTRTRNQIKRNQNQAIEINWLRKTSLFCLNKKSKIGIDTRNIHVNYLTFQRKQRLVRYIVKKF